MENTSSKSEVKVYPALLIANDGAMVVWELSNEFIANLYVPVLRKFKVSDSINQQWVAPETRKFCRLGYAGPYIIYQEVDG